MTIHAAVEYLGQRSGKPIYYASSAGRDAAHRVDQPMRRVTVEVEDARQRSEPVRDDCGLHPSGFDLVATPTRVRDFVEERQFAPIYDAEIEALLKTVTGGYRVHVFDHTLRAADPNLRAAKNVREPASLVHNDYTARSGFKCLCETLGEEAAEPLARGRFQIVNVWRPLVDPVEDHPLALCDVRTLEPADIVDTERRSATHVGEIQLAVHRPQHRWFYYPAMRPSEVLVFRTFDSLAAGNTPCSIHTAVHLPDAPADAAPRESIETRAFVFYQ